jgi:hypothetical protein
MYFRGVERRPFPSCFMYLGGQGQGLVGGGPWKIRKKSLFCARPSLITFIHVQGWVPLSFEGHQDFILSNEIHHRMKFIQV